MITRVYQFQTIPKCSWNHLPNWFRHNAQSYIDHRCLPTNQPFNLYQSFPIIYQSTNTYNPYVRENLNSTHITAMIHKRNNSNNNDIRANVRTIKRQILIRVIKKYTTNQMMIRMNDINNGHMYIRLRPFCLHFFVFTYKSKQWIRFNSHILRLRCIVER